MSKNPFPNDGYQHYYLYDSQKQPLAVVVICPGTASGTVIRGIAVRSDLDRWDRVKGRKVALGRCRKALNCRCTSQPMNSIRAATGLFYHLYGPEYMVPVSDNAGGYRMDLMKSVFNAKPTAKEVKILECLVKRMVAGATPLAE